MTGRDCVYEFGPFRVVEADGLLLRGGTSVPLLPKSFDALLVLVKNGGRVLTKDALLTQVWTGTIVEENSVAKAISEIRKALDDDVRNPQYIVTVPGRGYRFIAPVKALESTRAGAHTVAVLPFTALTPRSDEGYVSVGLADAVIARLSRLPQIIVRPTTAVLKYAGANKDVVAAGRELDVELVVDGTVRQAGLRIRVTVQLIETRSGTIVWAERFDDESIDIFGIEDSIAARVAAQLSLQMTREEAQLLVRRDTDDADACEHYMKGRFFWSKRTTEGAEAAIACFEAALARDPNYAQAYAGLADAYIILGLQGASMAGQPPAQTFPRAKAAVERALGLDNTLAEAHAVVGFIKFFYEFDRPGAERALHEAMARNPHYAAAHQLHAITLMAAGRMDDALAQIQRARQLDPVSLIINANVAWVLYHARRFDDALVHAREALAMDAAFPVAHHRLGLVLEAMGRHAEAIAAFEEARRLTNGGPLTIAAVAYVHALAGRMDIADRMLGELLRLSRERYVAAPSVAEIHTARGDGDQAIAWLEKGFDERSSAMVRLRVNPRFDPLRTDPRFTRLIERVGI